MREQKLDDESSDEDIFYKFEMLGKNIGAVLRSILNFDQDLI